MMPMRQPGGPAPEDDRFIDQMKRDEPPRSRMEALQAYLHKALSGETLQIQLDGCEAFLSIGIPIGDKENRKAAIENWDAWRDHAVNEKRRVTSNIGVSQTMMHKEGESGNDLRPIGGATDASALESIVRDMHVSERVQGLERTQLRAAVDVLKDLVGELLDVLTERGYFPDTYEDVNIPASAEPTAIRLPKQITLERPEPPQLPEPEVEEGDPQ